MISRGRPVGGDKKIRGQIMDNEPSQERGSSRAADMHGLMTAAPVNESLSPRSLHASVLQCRSHLHVPHSAACLVSMATSLAVPASSHRLSIRAVPLHRKPRFIRCARTFCQCF